MKLLVSLFTAVGLAAATLAQDYLTPETGILAEENEYHAKLRELFAETFRSDIVLQAVFLPSFEPEAIAGIRKTSSGLEAFASRPSYHIAEKIEAARLNKESRADFRDLTVHTETRAISAAFTERIRHVWENMLLSARYPKTTVIGFDGMDVHFSMWVDGRGIISGKIWSPQSGKAAALEDLAEVLGDYAEGKADEKKLAKCLKPLER